LLPAEAQVVFDGIGGNADIFNKIKTITVFQNDIKMSSVLNKGVMFGRAGAVTAAAALRAGTDISGVEKGNNGLSVLCKEAYFALSLQYDQIANMARIGRSATGFSKKVDGQFQESFSDDLEDKMWSGDNGTEEPYGFEVNAKANLATGTQPITTAIDEVRTVDTDGHTTYLESLRALRNVQRIKWRKKVTYFMNTVDYDKYADEIGDTTSYSTKELVTEAPVLKFNGRPVVATPYISEGTIIACPLDNMIKVINVAKFNKSTELIKTPISLVYQIAMFWNLQFGTFDKVAVAFDQTA
jgi:hypothetical protein